MLTHDFFFHSQYSDIDIKKCKEKNQYNIICNIYDIFEKSQVLCRNAKIGNSYSLQY